MKLRLAAAALALPLLAFDCGGAQPEPNPFGTCALHVRGAGPGVNEDLWCVVTSYDYAPASTTWAFELSAYRGMTSVAGGAGVFLAGRPAVGTAYGWSGATSSVDSGGATRSIGDAMATPPTLALTHEATALAGTGALSVTFTQVPPPGATGAQLLNVHGTLTATLEALDGVSPPVTFSATF